MHVLGENSARVVYGGGLNAVFVVSSRLTGHKDGWKISDRIANGPQYHCQEFVGWRKSSGTTACR